jgi:hypothetical protein
MQFDAARIHTFARTQAKTAREKTQEGLLFQECLDYWDAVAVRISAPDISNLKPVLQALLFAQERELSRAQEADSEAFRDQREVTEKWIREAQENVRALKELLARA